MNTLKLEHISKRYERDRWALEELSLTMKAGVWGIVGPNGAGKTTLLRMLATLLQPTKGSITWDEKDVLRSPSSLRRQLGYLPQEFNVYPQLTAREFLSYIGELKGLRGPLLRRRVTEVLEDVHLTEDAERRLRTFSGGMIRRIGIAQTLLAEPRLLIFDEPTTGLDPAERVYFRELIVSLIGERLVILSTHIITDVEAMATNVLLLQKGKLCWSGLPSTLQSDTLGAVWTAEVGLQEFEHLRTLYQISSAVRRGQKVEARFIAPVSPHPQAVAVEPTLEEAYLHRLSEK